MKKCFFAFLFSLIGMAGFSQSLPFPTQRVFLQCTNIDVRWKASKHPWPKKLWTYQVKTTKFPSTIASNLMGLSNLTEKDRWGYSSAEGVTYYNSESNLRIAYSEGEIQYDGGRRRYSETNLAVDVPKTNQLFQLTTNFLPQLGINFSEIPKTKDGRLKIDCTEPELSMFYVGNTIITNIEYRTASFGRLIDGVECDPHVGSCRINFGEHGRIISIWLYWRNVERDKLYQAATPKKIIQWMREGKAGFPRDIYVGMGSEMPIDWSRLKRVTINQATAYNWGETFFGEREHRPILPSQVIPYAMLQATFDMGATNFDASILCPIIDETKP